MAEYIYYVIPNPDSPTRTTSSPPFTTVAEARAYQGDHGGAVWRFQTPIGVGEFVPDPE
jgi:hypothetical protein